MISQQVTKRFKRFMQSKLKRKLNPQTVNYKRAFAWFEDQREKYERLSDLVVKLIHPDCIIVDVGASIGYFSLILMDKLHFKGEAHLFEPLPNLAKLCEFTFKERPYNVHIHAIGLADKAGVMTLYISDNGNIGWNTAVKEKRQDHMKPIEVPIRSFDELVLPVPGFIKIDVEGMEYRVIRGMLNTLENAKFLPLILCEIGWGRYHPYWDEEIKEFERLLALGYTISDTNERALNLDSINQTKDVLFIPPN